MALNTISSTERRVNVDFHRYKHKTDENIKYKPEVPLRSLSPCRYILANADSIYATGKILNVFTIIFNKSITKHYSQTPRSFYLCQLCLVM